MPPPARFLRDNSRRSPSRSRQSGCRRSSIRRPTASAHLSIALRLGHVALPRSSRDTALCVVHILRATSRWARPAATRARGSSAPSICSVGSRRNARGLRRPRARRSGALASAAGGPHIALPGAGGHSTTKLAPMLTGVRETYRRPFGRRRRRGPRARCPGAASRRRTARRCAAGHRRRSSADDCGARFRGTLSMPHTGLRATPMPQQPPGGRRHAHVPVPGRARHARCMLATAGRQGPRHRQQSQAGLQGHPVRGAHRRRRPLQRQDQQGRCRVARGDFAKASIHSGHHCAGTDDGGTCTRAL